MNTAVLWFDCFIQVFTSLYHLDAGPVRLVPQAGAMKEFYSAQQSGAWSAPDLYKGDVSAKSVPLNSIRMKDQNPSGWKSEIRRVIFPKFVGLETRTEHTKVRNL